MAGLGSGHLKIGALFFFLTFVEVSPVIEVHTHDHTNAIMKSIYSFSFLWVASDLILKSHTMVFQLYAIWAHKSRNLVIFSA